MNTKSKIVLLAASFVLLFAVGGHFLLKSEQQELIEIHQDREAGDLRIFNNQLSLINESQRLLTYDYSYWDDILEFVKAPDTVWAIENLQPATSTFKVDALWLTDKDFHVVYNVMKDEEEEFTTIELPFDLKSVISDDWFNHFFVNSTWGKLEIRTAPLQPSADQDRKTTPQGYFITGVLWDSDYVTMVSDLIESHVTVEYPNSENQASNLTHLHDNEPDIGVIDFRFELKSWNDTVQGYLISSKEAASFAKIAASTKRDIIDYSLFMLGLMALILIGAYQFIYQPLQNLSESLRRDDPSLLNDMLKRDDELGSLARLVTKASEQKKELVASEIKYRSLFENMQEGYAYCQMLYENNEPIDFIYLDVNESFESLTGLKNVVGKKVSDVIPGILESDKELFRIYGAVSRGGETQKIEFHVEALKQWFSLLIYSPKRDHFVAVFDVITERKNAELELRNSKIQLANAIDIARLGPWEYDVAADQFTFNDAFYSLFRTTAIEAGGYKMSSADYAGKYVHPDELPLVGEEIGKALSTEDPNYSSILEHRVLYADGQIGHFSVQIFIEKDSTGRTVKTYGVNQDITKRKLAEAELVHSEELHRLVVENTSSMIEFQCGGVTQFVNRSGLAMYGATDPNQVIGHPIIERIPEYARSYVLADIEDMLNTGVPRRGIKGILLKLDGTPFNVEMNAVPFIYKGMPASLIDVQDVTEKLKAERESIASELRYRRLFEAAKDGILILDSESGKIVDANPFILDMLGYTLAELKDKAIWDIGWGIDVEESKAKFLKLQDREYIRYENLPLKSKAGNEHLVEFISNVYDVAGKPVIQCNIRDITERIRADKMIKESAEKFRALFDNARDAILVRHIEPDKLSTFTEVNLAATELLGFTHDELLCMTPFDIAAEEDRPHMLQRSERLLQEGVNNFEMLVQSKDGIKVPVEVNAHTFLFSDNWMVVSVLRDLSARKILEGQLRQSQKMESIGQLAGGVAHDFNNLLTVISGNCELAMIKLKDNDPVREDINEIADAADRAASLTRQLLAFSRKQALAPKIVDLNYSINNMEKMLRRLIGEDVTLVCKGSLNLWKVKVDPGQIEQVIINLAVNARDAMPDGGSLTIETDNIVLDKEYIKLYPEANAGQHVMLAVSDTGIGMSSEIVSKIFDPFFTTKEVGKGTGLGLSTVYGIVKQSNGSINVYSEVGKGTAFKIYLPAAQEESNIDAVNLTTDNSKLRGDESILVVEDERAVREIAVKFLEAYGYKVTAASNGQEAIDLYLAGSLKFDLLLTDVVMPKMKGNELAAIMRGHIPGLKVIFMSGYTTNAVVNQGIIDPDSPYLPKPFRPVELATKVREVLDRDKEK